MGVCNPQPPSYAYVIINIRREFVLTQKQITLKFIEKVLGEKTLTLETLMNINVFDSSPKSTQDLTKK